MTTENNEHNDGVFSSTNAHRKCTNEEIYSEVIAEYEKCITCPDHGKNCKGPKLASLRTIANVREYHRRLRNYRKITMKQIFLLTEHEVSDATVKDYFSHEEKDFRWTTVSLIDRALTSICGGCGGTIADDLPPCPASSSEIKDQIEKIADQLRIAEAECLALQAKIAENKGKHIEQMNEFRQDQQDRVEWLKADVRLWQKIAFSLLGVVTIVVISLLAYLAWDIANPNTGFIRW